MADMSDNKASPEHGPLMMRLARMRFLTRLTMVFERLWPLMLPLVLVAGLFLSLSWFGVFRVVPGWTRVMILLILGLCLVVSFWPFRRLKRPSEPEIDRRIELSNKLQHAPAATQRDQLAAGGEDAFAQALWKEHQARMARQLSQMKSDLPRTRVPDRDPWGLRAVVALLFVTALAFSLSPLSGSISDIFGGETGAEAASARVDAWVTPPGYTGKAPVFLTAEANLQENRFSVPQNSQLQVRISGGGEGTQLLMRADEGDDQLVAPDATDEGISARQYSLLLTENGEVELSGGGVGDLSWHFEIVPDAPPSISFTQEPRRAAIGALELIYAITDDYGAVSAQGIMELEAFDPKAQALYEAPEISLGLPRRNAKDGAAKSSIDLTEHPWAGKRVRLVLEARDAADQAGRSEAKSFALPQRPFSNPVSRALIEQRQMLALDARERDRVARLMDAVLLWPEETFDEPRHFLLISAARSKLGIARNDDALRQVVDDLWEIALIIEDGDLTAAEKRLRQAQEALRQALEDGASNEEIEQLMSELREAMREFLREFAERNQQQNNQFSQNQNSQMMTQNDLERMLDQMEDLAKNGARDQAQDLLSQLQDMMNNLQAGRPQQGQNGQQQSQMRQQMDQLGDLMRRQQELMNETFRLDQQQQGNRQGQMNQPGQPGGEGQEQGENGQGMSPEELAEALRELQQGQGQLQQELQGLMDDLEGMGIQPGEGFGEAGEAMGEAEGALGEGEGERAVGEQGRALEAMRRGAQDMMNQMQQAMQGQQGQGQQGRAQGQNGQDPLGRPRASTGPDFGDSVEVPDEIDRQRAREILDAIRKRLGDALSPELEKQYLERLLELQ
ncbi:TIGR02302 family protein [Nitratireductor basaltis]|uniref:TIGR02302 family protein n=1 Tax=Nitratireductor basaltis TaxID=472175 RepID=A0A084U7G2_9HYPH|nr:TIGR02302 family protein [Nitratireductor basaltis]KFB08898.1 hypothetical protein EL18_03153 [Nitratireductor basaltis]